MTQSNEPNEAIVRTSRLPPTARSNVKVCSNVYVRVADIAEPQQDVAFRCRIRGWNALRAIVPPGIMNSVSGRHDIRVIPEAARSAAMDGLHDEGFELLAEQEAGISPFCCIYCGRSEVSVWHDAGKLKREFVKECICKRTKMREEDQ